DLAFGVAGVEEDAPAVVAHLHVVEMRPAARVHADGGAQVDVEIDRTFRAHVAPPTEEVGLPLLERALQGAVVAEVDVVRNLLAVVDAAHAVSSKVVNAIHRGHPWSRLCRATGCAPL